MNWVAGRTVLVKLLSNIFKFALYLPSVDDLLAEYDRKL